MLLHVLLYLLSRAPDYHSTNARAFEECIVSLAIAIITLNCLGLLFKWLSREIILLIDAGMPAFTRC